MRITIINKAILELNKLKIDCLDRRIEIYNIFPTLNKILLGFYGKKNRFYHNLTHVVAVVKHCRKYAKNAENSLELILAAWFHDVIYASRTDNNEALSARLFERIFLQTNMPHNMIAKIKQYILHTKNHLLYTDGESAIFLDADLKILSSSWQKYLEYSLNIQKEYAFFSNNEYSNARKKFLENFLKQVESNNGKIYRHLPERYNKRAINNLKRELIDNLTY